MDSDSDVEVIDEKIDHRFRINPFMSLKNNHQSSSLIPQNKNFNSAFKAGHLSAVLQESSQINFSETNYCSGTSKLNYKKITDYKSNEAVKENSGDVIVIQDNSDDENVDLTIGKQNRIYKDNLSSPVQLSNKRNLKTKAGSITYPVSDNNRLDNPVLDILHQSSLLTFNRTTDNPTTYPLHQSSKNFRNSVAPGKEISGKQSSNCSSLKGIQFRDNMEPNQIQSSSKTVRGHLALASNSSVGVSKADDLSGYLKNHIKPTCFQISPEVTCSLIEVSEQSNSIKTTIDPITVEDDSAAVISNQKTISLKTSHIQQSAPLRNDKPSTALESDYSFYTNLKSKIPNKPAELDQSIDTESSICLQKNTLGKQSATSNSTDVLSTSCTNSDHVLSTSKTIHSNDSVSVGTDSFNIVLKCHDNSDCSKSICHHLSSDGNYSITGSAPSTPKNKTSTCDDKHSGTPKLTEKVVTPSTPTELIVIESSQIKYSKAINSVPGKYFGSPKKSSPTKKLGKFSPFRKSNRNKPYKLSPSNHIDRYFKSCPKKLNFSNVEKVNNKVNKIIPQNDTLSVQEPSSVVNNENRQSSDFNVVKVEKEFKKEKHVQDIISLELSEELAEPLEKENDDLNLSESMKTNEASEQQNETSEDPFIGTQEMNDILEILKQKEDPFINEILLIQQNSNAIGSPIKQDETVNKSQENKEEEERKVKNSDFNYSVMDNVVRFVLNGSEDYLLSTFDHSVYKQMFINTPKSAQLLYFRLFSRKHAWIRKKSMKCKYSYLSKDISKELNDLTRLEFITTDQSSESLDAVLSLLDVKELKNLCKMYHLPVIGKKVSLISSLIKMQSSQQIIVAGMSNDASSLLRARAEDLLGECAKLTEGPRNTFFKFLRLFAFSYATDVKDNLFTAVSDRFSSRHQFPDYDIKHVPVFYSSDCFEEYEKALQLRGEIEAASTAKKNDVVIKLVKEAEKNFINILHNEEIMKIVREMPDFLRKYTAGYCYGSCISLNIPAFKKNKTMMLKAVNLLELLLSQDVYLISKRGVWYLDLIIILNHHLKDYNKVGQCFLQLQKDNINVVSQNALYDQANLIVSRKHVPEEIKSQIRTFNPAHVSLNNIKGKTILAKAMPSLKPGIKRVYKTEYESYVEYSSVEEVALCHFKNNGYQRGYCDEGKFLRSVLLACFWDVIYCVPEYESENVSVFVNCFQSEPLDWSTTSFYKRRQQKIQEKLEALSSGGHNEIINTIKQCIDLHENIDSVIDWKLVNKGTLLLVEGFVKCLPLNFFISAADHLLKDYRSFASGFPDLTLWNPVPNDYKLIFVEVKGPNDTLSNKQKLWLQNINKFGADASICYVQDTATGYPVKPTRSSGSSKKRKMAVDDSQNF
ncbi:uncharacterized protein LOC142322470 [Lycorma delicatula]|uniref:uncharacterized protein LOC142322470 n=1 Tax=Lycorma delicatula TaxID=130591 RepID=UPI003F513B37